MHKVLTLFKREYRAAVRTKGFIISLILVPLMMGGGFLAFIIMENKQDTDDKTTSPLLRAGDDVQEKFLQILKRNNLSL